MQMKAALIDLYQEVMDGHHEANQFMGKCLGINMNEKALSLVK